MRFFDKKRRTTFMGPWLLNICVSDFEKFFNIDCIPPPQGSFFFRPRSRSLSTPTNNKTTKQQKKQGVLNRKK